ncbi:hypothetical protein XH84_15000 [Bradyrhizobium nanningense]|nr:hypothetical protein XH84_15000 [Bradyrhizobium nanningense]
MLDDHDVAPGAQAVYADGDAMTGEHKRRGRKLRDLVGVEDSSFRGTIGKYNALCLFRRARPCGMLKRLMWTD